MDLEQKNKMETDLFSPLIYTNNVDNINDNDTNNYEDYNNDVNYDNYEKNNSNNINDFIYESPKNIINNNSANIYSYSTNTNPILTTNSFGKTVKKFNVTNMQTQYSKVQQSQINNSNSSKYPITTYISSSSLQNHNCIFYSIPKESRFTHTYRVATCQSIYNLTEHKPKGITIPHSTRKNNFMKFDSTPSSNNYIMTSLFEDNLKMKKGISISSKNSLLVY
jgi:hypothetical protein